MHRAHLNNRGFDVCYFNGHITGHCMKKISLVNGFWFPEISMRTWPEYQTCPHDLNNTRLRSLWPEWQPSQLSRCAPYALRILQQLIIDDALISLTNHIMLFIKSQSDEAWGIFKTQPLMKQVELMKSQSIVAGIQYRMLKNDIYPVLTSYPFSNG